MYIDYIKTAKLMLELNDDEDLPDDLATMLTDVHTYCYDIGGGLRSRQIVASIIVFWENK